MTTDPTIDRERYAEARQHVQLLRGFYGHALVFVLVNLGLAAINLASDPTNLWIVPTFVGWGLGLIGHGAYVWSDGRLLGPAWRDRKIQERLDRSR